MRAPRISVWWLAAAGLAGLAVGLGLGSGSAGSRRPNSGATETDGGERWRAVETRLEELQRAVERLSLADAAPTAPAREPMAAAPAAGGAGTAAAPDGAVLAAIARLDTELRAEIAALRTLLDEREPSAERLERLRDRPVDWAALEALVATWRRDAAAAEDEVELMTTASVLERFGPPTAVWTNTNGIHWKYTSGVEGDWQVILRVPDGYVTNLIVR